MWSAMEARMEALPLVLKGEDVAKVMSIARQTAYELAHRQGFPAVRLGRCIRIPREAFLTWLNTPAGQAEDNPAAYPPTKPAGALWRASSYRSRTTKPTIV
jgi:excisionase family DNA binding protein